MREEAERAARLEEAAARQRAKEAKVRHQRRLQGRLGTHHSHRSAFCTRCCAPVRRPVCAPEGDVLCRASINT